MNPSSNTDVSQRARRAVEVFRAMQFSLNGYVRAISGRKDLHIQITSGTPRTDGKTIYFQPPLALGDKTPHTRILCDRRHPETGRQLCDACAVREDVLIKIYHEIAHNIYGTFDKPLSEKIIQAIVEAVKAKGPQAKARIRAQWEDAVRRGQDSYLNLAGILSPFLPVLVNALEDARVDEAMFQARPGTRAMFDAMTQSIFVEGVEQDSGTMMKWTEMPLNSQVLVGIFTVACKYNYAGWFVPEVEAALNDSLIQELCDGVDKMHTVHQTYEQALPILARLQELGFCKTEEEQDESEEEPSKDEGQGDPKDSESSSKSSDSDEFEEGESESGDSSDGREGSDGSSEDSGVSGSETSDKESEELEDQSGTEESNSELAEDDAEDGSADDVDSSDDPKQSGAGEDASEDSSGNDGSDKEDEASEGSSGESGDSDSSDELIDTGADEGQGGVKIEKLPYGTPEQALEHIQVITKHGDHLESAVEEGIDAATLERAILQGMYFESDSIHVAGVQEFKYGQSPTVDYYYAWRYADNPNVTSERDMRRLGTLLDETSISESVLGPSLMKMRRVFSDNERAKYEHHLKSGRINTRVLGKRAPFKDERLFQKKRLPGKRSYAVILGVDISGSTVGLNLALAKQSAMAQAKLLHRMGIDFAVYAHSATNNSLGFTLDMYEIKAFDSPWDKKAHEALSRISSSAENLDGHSIEYYRKMIERHPATDKIILYYSDGKMPAANAREELVILQREIQYCKRHKITLLGVGIRTDSPRRHGLDTVQVDRAEDVALVIQHLESALLHNR